MRRKRGELRLRFPLAATDELLFLFAVEFAAVLFFFVAVLLGDEDGVEDWVEDCVEDCATAAGFSAETPPHKTASPKAKTFRTEAQ
jgi:hypothetical protein